MAGAKLKKRITRKQRAALAYQNYSLSWDLYDHAVAGDKRSIEAMLSMVDRDAVLSKAAAIGFYHRFLGESQKYSESEFYDIFDSLETNAGGIFVMDGGTTTRSEYEQYLTTYFLHRLDNASVFTAIRPTHQKDAIINLALEDSSDPGLSGPRSSDLSKSTTALGDLLAPLAASLGVAMLTQLVSKRKSEEVVCH